ncbi:hypothetical protein [Nonomuraea sp. NPDC049480]|uniref:hypothetical protein n=1 Tax=Nonomuraea sp. NPDC049480 TaxID=3364353 RepID=UPI0037BD94EC
MSRWPRPPRVYQTLLELQMLDITKAPIEIAPTAHYSMGGVWVRPEDHGTGVDGLYARRSARHGRRWTDSSPPTAPRTCGHCSEPCATS